MRTPRDRAAPPATLAALLDRARSIAGHTVGELAAQLRMTLPESTTRGKGFVGMLVEDALGASAGSRSEPDFPALGVELKTLPMDARGRVLESTFVATIPLTAISGQDWDRSTIAGKLAQVLFVPVEGKPVPVAQRRIGAPLLWVPSESERARIEQDFESIAANIAHGELERMSARDGDVMQVRPKGRKGGDRRLHFDADGHARMEQPRGVYLRARFTAEVVARLRDVALRVSP